MTRLPSTLQKGDVFDGSDRRKVPRRQVVGKGLVLGEDRISKRVVMAEYGSFRVNGAKIKFSLRRKEKRKRPTS
jgi:hypothetical protein